jgi:hypothetical protein
MDPYFSLTQLAAFLCAALALSFVYKTLAFHGQRNLPPGPPSDPFIGHARKIPPEYQEKAFAEWTKTYGQLYSSSS